MHGFAYVNTNRLERRCLFVLFMYALSGYGYPVTKGDLQGNMHKSKKKDRWNNEPTFQSPREIYLRRVVSQFAVYDGTNTQVGSLEKGTS